MKNPTTEEQGRCGRQCCKCQCKCCKCSTQISLIFCVSARCDLATICRTPSVQIRQKSCCHIMFTCTSQVPQPTSSQAGTLSNLYPQYLCTNSICAVYVCTVCTHTMLKWENNNFPFFQAGAKGLPPALHIQDEQSEWRLVATFRENQAFVTFKKPCRAATTHLQKNLWIQPPPTLLRKVKL